jgi:hypothetical protein
MMSFARDDADNNGLYIFDDYYPRFEYFKNMYYKFGYYYFKNNYPADKKKSDNQTINLKLTFDTLFDV